MRQRVYESYSGSDIPWAACTKEDFQNKSISLLIYGATGFTGRLAAAYLANHRDAPARWAIGGRWRSKLEQLKQLLGGTALNAEVFTGSLQDKAALRDMVRRAKVVLSFAGPYEPVGGEMLVQAALAGCTHYVDVSGETTWNILIYWVYSSLASVRRVALVQSAGAGSMPADVLALQAAEKVASDHKGPPSEVTVAIHKYSNHENSKVAKSGIKVHEQLLMNADPYALAPETPSEARIDIQVNGVRSFGYDELFNRTTRPWAVAEVDCPVMRRTLGLRFPGAPIRVSEVQTDQVELTMRLLEGMRKSKDPRPLVPVSQGPAWVHRDSSFAVEAVAQREKDGRTVRCKFEGYGDPGFLGTAKMAVELALGLVRTGPANGAGGYLTPALALYPGQLLGRLAHADYGAFLHFFSAVEKPGDTA